MEMPRQFLLLISDYNPDNLNMMNGSDLHRLFKYTREMAEALDEIQDEEGLIEKHSLSLEKFLEWK